MKVDVVIGLQHGDEGKGKVTNSYLKNGNYDWCVKFNGGPNAGHSFVREDGEIFVTHQVPLGVFHGVKSIIGAGCVVTKDVPPGVTVIGNPSRIVEKKQ